MSDVLGDGFSDAMMRPMEHVDLSSVMEIELRAYPQPWEEKAMEKCLQTTHYHGFVLEIAGKIQGYLFLSVVVGEMHILNICVSPDIQGKGWGRELLQRTLDLGANQYQANMCFLEVRPSNTSALALYASEGFSEIGMRKNYYPAADGREDALVMAKSIIT
jgi:ribosomal-protein-alanine N-acetyltransferase